MSTLVLVRHAKADNPLGVGDRERPLSERGRADAQTLRAILTPLVNDGAIALVSDAVRARQTAELAGLRDLPGVEVRELPDLYGATSGFGPIIECIRRVEQDVTVVVVAHNPGLEELAATTPGGESVGNSGLPTSGVVVIDVAAPWAGFSAGMGRVIAQAVGRA
jgi:phosphohistidine phosphatase